ncbi:MAG: nucleotidyltransferase domain-containing protein [Actinophytocola sp.]|uniref:nucleotidyltransferase domain-containing protein n=1 Tax=Actinophytocola sp. TaxID=1872138 RepID=UPI003C78D154
MAVEVRYPTAAHRRLVDEILSSLRARPGVGGVLLGGSLARGTARDDSDVDILVVATTDDRPRIPGSLPVDLLVRTEEQWRRCFTPDRVGDESWGYAFLDGVVLHDPDGVVADLVTRARDCHTRYRTPASITAHYAALWRHVRPKMLAVHRRGDPVEVGWAAAAMTNDLLRTAWAVNDLPNPSLDLGTVQRHLDDLTIPPGIADLLRALLRSSPQEGLRAQLELLGTLEPHLSAPPGGTRSAGN